MSVNTSVYMMLLPSLDDKGWRWFATATINGDASGGQSTGSLFLPINWDKDAYLILDNWNVATLNAATDQVTLNPTGFEGQTFVLDNDVTSKAWGSQFFVSRHYARGLYIGRSIAGGAAYLQFSCNPNTNGKSFVVNAHGRLLLNYPSADRDEIG